MVDRQTEHRYRIKVAVWIDTKHAGDPLWRAQVIAASAPEIEHVVNFRSALSFGPTSAIASLLIDVFSAIDSDQLGALVTEIEVGPTSAARFSETCGRVAVERG